MKILKKLLLGFGMAVLALLALSFFLPSKFHFERYQVIGVSREVLFDQVNTTKNWEKWSPWHKIDPNMKLSYTGPTSGVGASYSWTSQDPKVGNGTTTLMSVALGDSITTKMIFDGFDAAYATYKFVPTDNGTKLIWSFDQDMGSNPVNKIFAYFFLEKMLAPDYEKGLNNLNQLAKTTLPTKVAPIQMSVSRTK